MLRDGKPVGQRGGQGMKKSQRVVRQAEVIVESERRGRLQKKGRQRVRKAK